MNLRQSVFSILLLALVATPAFGDERVDAIFANHTSATPGVALAVIRDGKIVYAKGYGLADLERNVPVTTTTVFDVGSIAKQFTATCIHLLALDGKLSLDDDVRKHFPELPKYDRPITVRHLLHHTSGLRDYLTLFSLSGRSLVNDYPESLVLDVISRQKGLNFAPGDEHLYSNTGYFLLGQLVERVSGKSLRAFAHERIFEPLGMKSTHFHDDIFEIVPNRALAYTPTPAGFRIDQSIFHVVGDGGVLTTVEDLALWDRNFYDNKLGGGPKLFENILVPGTLTSGQQIPYASALLVSTYRGLPAIHHSGAWAGYRAEMIRFPEQRVTVAVLSNAGNLGNPVLAARKVAEIYLGDLMQAAPTAAAAAAPAADVKAVDISAKEIEARAGLYRDASNGVMRRLAIDGGRLVYDRMNGVTSPLVPVASDRFRMMNVPVAVEISFASEGGRQRMVVAQEGAPPLTLERIEQAAPSAPELAAYAGAYYAAELEATHTVAASDGRLVMRLGSGDELPLDPLARDEFSAPGGVTVRFTRENGRVTGMSLGAGRVRDIGFVRRS